MLMGCDGGDLAAARQNTSGQTGAAAGTSASGDGSAPPVPFDSTRAWEHLRRQVEFGPRPAGSDALAETRRYIIDQLTAAGIDAREQPFTARTPIGELAMANVIGVIPGRRADRIALASHYDTKRAPFRFVGANDGASSTAVVLELARVLAARPNEFTIELLFFDGEEAVNWEWQGDDNTYGSRHYVQTARRDGTLGGLKALVLLDMVGDTDLLIRRDSNSTPWLVDIIWTTAARLGYRHVFSNALTTIEDDHIPFLRAGIPAVDVIDLDYPAWHTADDDLDQVSAESLQIVGEVILASWPAIENRLASAGSSR
jgi:glutaminyl-peptide cyclotransferase